MITIIIIVVQFYLIRVRFEVWKEMKRQFGWGLDVIYIYYDTFIHSLFIHSSVLVYYTQVDTYPYKVMSFSLVGTRL